MNLDDLLNAVSEELEALPADATPSTEQARVLAAFAAVLERVDHQQVSPFQERILRTLETLSPREGSPPVPTVRLMSEISGLDNRFTTWYHLKALEEKGLVCRPRGPKSGWKARTA